MYRGVLDRGRSRPTFQQPFLHHHIDTVQRAVVDSNFPPAFARLLAHLDYFLRAGTTQGRPAFSLQRSAVALSCLRTLVPQHDVLPRWAVSEQRPDTGNHEARADAAPDSLAVSRPHLRLASSGDAQFFSPAINIRPLQQSLWRLQPQAYSLQLRYFSQARPSAHGDPAPERLAVLPRTVEELEQHIRKSSGSLEEACSAAKAADPGINSEPFASTRRPSFHMRKGESWQTVKHQLEQDYDVTSQTAVVHAIINLSRFCTSDHQQHAELLKDGLPYRLLDRFVELGLANASAINISGLCMGLERLNCLPTEEVWTQLQSRMHELCDSLSLEDVRRILSFSVKVPLPAPKDFMGTLYAAMRQRLDENNLILMTRLSWILGRVEHKPDQALQLLLAQQASTFAPDMDARGIAAILCGFGHMGMRHPPAGFLNAVTTRLEQAVDSSAAYSASNLDSLLFNLLVLTDNEADRQRYQGIIDKLKHALQQLDPTAENRASGKLRQGSLFIRKDDSWQTIRHLFTHGWDNATQTAIAWGLIVMSRSCIAQPEQHAQLMEDGIVPRLLDKFMELGVENATAVNVSGLCMGLAALRHSPREDMWRALSKRALELVQDFTLEDMRRVLYLVASLSLHVPNSFVRAFFPCIRRRLDESNHIILMSLVWALGRLHPRPHHELQVVLAEEAAKHVPDLDARGIGMLMSGFAHMNLRRPPSGFLDACALRIPEVLPGFKPNTFGNVVWSLNIMTDDGIEGWRYAKTVDKMVAAAVHPRMLPQFSPQLLAMLCEGLARMDYRPSEHVMTTLVAHFEDLVVQRHAGSVRLMDCTTMLQAASLWGVLPEGLGTARTEKLLQAIEDRWQEGIGSVWYLSNKVAPVLRRLVVSEGHMPGVKAKAQQLLRMCFVAIEEQALVRGEQQYEDEFATF